MNRLTITVITLVCSINLQGSSATDALITPRSKKALTAAAQLARETAWINVQSSFATDDPAYWVMQTIKEKRLTSKEPVYFEISLNDQQNVTYTTYVRLITTSIGINFTPRVASCFKKHPNPNQLQELEQALKDHLLELETTSQAE
ncbi:hypothetical protein KBD08_04535 [Candidatus Babeliales bacterium]|nr:hypothetical protein [Candidatus Babeliales bacterium]